MVLMGEVALNRINTVFMHEIIEYCKAGSSVETETWRWWYWDVCQLLLAGLQPRIISPFIVYLNL